MNHNSTAFVGCDQGQVCNMKAMALYTIATKLFLHDLVIIHDFAKRITACMHSIKDNKKFSCPSVVHVLDPKVEDKIIAVQIALQLTVEQSKEKRLFGFG